MKQENLKLVFLGVGALIVGFLGWYLYDSLSGQKRDTGIASRPQRFQETSDSGQPQPTSTVVSDPFDKPTGVQTRTNLLSIKGIVKKVGDRKLTIEETLVNGEKHTWVVKVNDQTKIIKHIDRPIEEVRKARAEGNKLRPYTEEEVDFSAFEVDQEVTISASENIAGQKEFTAKEIIIRIRT